jgi:integrase
MELVDPIRSIKKIEDLKEYMLEEGNVRNYALVVLGLNSALRISDILALKWDDVYNLEEHYFKTHVSLKEKKTGKTKKFLLNKNAVNALKRLRKERGNIKLSEYVFLSREGQNKPITRIMALKIIKDGAAAVRIKDRIGCHSLRKTFGYWSWKKGTPLPLLTELFNHSNQQITRRYLGISQDDLDEVYRLVEL